jgi:hypothetical protein
MDMYEWYGDIGLKESISDDEKYVTTSGISQKITFFIMDWVTGMIWDQVPGSTAHSEICYCNLYFYDMKLLGKMASLIGENDDADYYGKLAEEVSLLIPGSSISRLNHSPSQTYSMPLFFGIQMTVSEKKLSETLSDR